MLRAEWTKFRTVRRYVVTVLAAPGIAIGLSSVIATTYSTDANQAPDVADQFHFVHQPLTGDGQLTAQVTSPVGGHPWARAGLMIKQAAASEAPFTAVFLTAEHGAFFQEDFAEPQAANSSGQVTSLWLRLSRSGESIRAETSTNGVTWVAAGAAAVTGMPPTAEWGLFVTSPPHQSIARQYGSSSITNLPSLASATFSGVSLTLANAGAPGDWVSQVIGDAPAPLPGGGATEQDGVWTVAGSGEIARTWGGDNDVVVQSMLGTLLGLLVVFVLGAVMMDAELRRSMIRTTFAACPRRVNALLAKTTIVAGIGLVVGVVAAVGSYTFARPLLANNGFAAPAYPELPTTDPVMLRVIGGTGLLFALVGAMAVALTALLRRAVPAIAILLVGLFLPALLAEALPLNQALWLGRVTPYAGMAIQQTITRWDTAVSPWAGLGVLAAYVCVLLGLALVRISRRDA